MFSMNTVHDKKRNTFFITGKDMVTEYLCKSLEVYECRNLFLCKSYLRSESTQAIQESWGHIVQLHREKSSSSTRYKNLYIFRKTIFYPITNLKFVNIGRFLPRLSGNNHSQLQSKAGLCLAHFDLDTPILAHKSFHPFPCYLRLPKYGYLNQSAPSKDLLSTKLGSGCSHLVLERNDRNSQNSGWIYSERWFFRQHLKKPIENDRFRTLNMT